MMYSTYKNSGFPWIGQIPEYWNFRRIKETFTLKGRIGWQGLRSEEFEDSSYAYLVTGQDFVKSDINWSKCYQVSKIRYDEDPFIQLRNGDVLITKDGTIGKVAKVTNLDKPASLNSGIFVMRELHKGLFIQNYLYWLLKSDVLYVYNELTKTGATIAHLYQNVFERMVLPIPPIAEQKRIADYLDEKTIAIDTQVSLLEQKAKKYEQLKKSLISHAVTRGLNKDVRLKESGIDWIGQIPEDWEIKRLKEIVRSISSGGTPTSSNENFYADEGTPWVSIGDMSTVDVVNSTEKKLTPFGIEDKSLIVYSAGTLLYSIFASIGKVSELGIDATINQAILALELKLGHNQRYIKYQLQAMESFAISQANGNTQLNLNAGIVRRFKLAIPPLSEQQAIADYLDKKTAEIDAAIANINQQIEKYKLLRRALINEVVTGQRAI